jgi:hypothetical protein
MEIYFTSKPIHVPNNNNNNNNNVIEAGQILRRTKSTMFSNPQPIQLNRINVTLQFLRRQTPIKDRQVGDQRD